MALRRHTELKPGRGTIIPSKVRNAVGDRDSWSCVCEVARFPAEVIADCPGGPVEFDHVRASGGLGMKSRSTEDNLVCLSWTCHRWKTLNGRTARPLLLAYLEKVNGAV